MVKTKIVNKSTESFIVTIWMCMMRYIHRINFKNKKFLSTIVLWMVGVTKSILVKMYTLYGSDLANRKDNRKKKQKIKFNLLFVIYTGTHI